MDGLYLHVSHEVAEQFVQLDEEELVRLPPPPIPKEENIFWISLLPQDSQETLFSFPIETRHSKCFVHFVQINSYIGITQYFSLFCASKQSEKSRDSSFRKPSPIMDFEVLPNYFMGLFYGYGCNFDLDIFG